MELKELTARLMVLFLPGLISALILDQLTVHRQQENIQFFIKAFILGMLSYLGLHLVINGPLVLLSYVGVFLVHPPSIIFFDSLFDSTKKVVWLEIVFATAFSIPLALGLSFALNRKWLHRLAQAAQITKKFGELDVWDFTFNSPNVRWVVIRDIKNDLMYYGDVRAFSDTVDDAQLLLRDVAVFRNSDSQFLYEAGSIYLSHKKDDIVIELADLGYKDAKNAPVL